MQRSKCRRKTEVIGRKATDKEAEYLFENWFLEKCFQMLN